MAARFAVALIAAALAPLCASAQDPLAPAREAFERADFRGAVQALDRAAEGDGLSRAQAVELLRGRALARHAARDAAGAEADLVALLSLEPHAELDEMAPPALSRRFARLRAETSASLSLDVAALPIPDGFTVRTEVRGDVASLVRGVRVRYRDGATWQSAEGREVRLVAGSRLEYVVEAIGPGGAVLVRQGSEREPLVARALDCTLADDCERGTRPRLHDDTPIVVAIATTSVVVAVVAVILAVALAPQGVQPSAPMEMR